MSVGAGRGTWFVVKKEHVRERERETEEENHIQLGLGLREKRANHGGCMMRRPKP